MMDTEEWVEEVGPLNKLKSIKRVRFQDPPLPLESVSITRRRSFCFGDSRGFTACLEKANFEVGILTFSEHLFSEISVVKYLSCHLVYCLE